MIGNPVTGEPDVVVVGAGIMSARSHYHIDVSAIAAKQSAVLKKTGRPQHEKSIAWGMS
jgi:hypothetical protein